MTDPSRDGVPTSLWSPGLRLAGSTMVVAMALMAFEGIGVATAMPHAVSALGGTGAYGWPFTAYLIASIVAYVASGRWCDRLGSRPVMLWGLGVFCLGSLTAGLAPSMLVFVLGRFVSGLGGGAALVATYVIVAALYPEAMHSKAFGHLATAWAVPAIVGPFIAGALTDQVTWRSVFWLVPFIAVPAIVALSKGLERERLLPSRSIPESRSQIPFAMALGAALVMVEIAGHMSGAAAVAVAAIGLAVLVLSLRRLLPPGALRFRPGLPSVIMLSGLLVGCFIAAEAFLPLALQSTRGLSSTQAGIVLVVGGAGFAAGSQLQGRLYPRLGGARVVALGAGLVALCLGSLPLALGTVPVGLAGVSWLIGSIGVGLCFGSLATLTMERAPEGTAGSSSSALQVSESTGSTFLIAVGSGVLAAAHTGGGPTTATFSIIWLAMAAVAAAGCVLARRIDA